MQIFQTPKKRRKDPIVVGIFLQCRVEESFLAPLVFFSSTTRTDENWMLSRICNTHTRGPTPSAEKSSAVVATQLCSFPNSFALFLHSAAASPGADALSILSLALSLRFSCEHRATRDAHKRSPPQYHHPLAQHRKEETKEKEEKEDGSSCCCCCSACDNHPAVLAFPLHCLTY